MLFPVKLGPLWWLVPSAVLACGCGYRAAYGGDEPAYRLSVAGAALRVPFPEAAQAALAGARAEAAREGVLRGGTGYPRLVVEIVRVDELASGIARSDAPGGALPLGRASAIGVTGRAWVEEGPSSPPIRATGDVRRVETVAQSEDVLGGSLAAGEGARAAARRVGEALVKRALGIAEPSVEPM
jgi:hypothetical protein